MSASSGPLSVARGYRGAAGRWVTLALLVLAYRLSFPPLHDAIGNPAFLGGLFLCLVAAASLGLRGALVAIVLVASIDRSFALDLAGPETGLVAAVISLLVKLLLAGGLGLVVDSRRRFAALSAQLRREVEARAQHEAGLRRSEELHRALVESLGEGVGLFDAEDRVVFANQSLANTLGMAGDELLGQRFSDFLAEQRLERGQAGEPQSVETRCYEVVLKRNASTLLLVTETKFEPAGVDGTLVLRVVRDLTERIVSERRQRDLERELQRSQSLSSLAVMAGGVAHDFNNLLCGVVGNAEIALR